MEMINVFARPTVLRAVRLTADNVAEVLVELAAHGLEVKMDSSRECIGSNQLVRKHLDGIVWAMVGEWVVLEEKRQALRRRAFVMSDEEFKSGFVLAMQCSVESEPVMMGWL